MPVVQILVLLDLAFLLALGYSPLGGDAWAFLGWLGIIVTLVLTVCALGMNRAWKDLRHIWVLPLIPLYSVFTSLTMVAALNQELRRKEARWNKLTRTGIVSVNVPAPRAEVRLETGWGLCPCWRSP
jgi:hypothetical protein